MARGRKSGHCEAAQFYVYQFVRAGEIIYIGKGSGNRLKQQERRFGFSGEIVKRFSSEKKAYDFEARMIAAHKPSENKAPGGGGAISRVRAKLSKAFRAELAEIERLGTRVYAARMLLRFDTRGHIPPSKIDRIRQVAYGTGS